MLATVTSVPPPGRFGSLDDRGDQVLTFQEKPEGNSWINGGFFVLSPAVIDYIEGTIRFGKRSLWNDLPGRASLRRTRTKASGTRWTRYATKTNLKRCGVPARLRGKCGHEPGILAEEKSLSHRSHRLQGKLAVSVAPEPWREGHRLLASSTHSAEPLCSGRRKERDGSPSEGTSLTWNIFAARSGNTGPKLYFIWRHSPWCAAPTTDPSGTYATNVLGTVHVLDAVRAAPCVRSRCHRHVGQMLRESRRPAGVSRDRSSRRALTHTAAAKQQQNSSQRPFVNPSSLPRNAEQQQVWRPARAGNVIGGGDWAADRLIPDVMRAVLEGRRSIDPASHMPSVPGNMYSNPCADTLPSPRNSGSTQERFSEGWNFGPDESETMSVSPLLECLKELWGPGVCLAFDDNAHPHEAQYLRLDCTKPKWSWVGTPMESEIPR